MSERTIRLAKHRGERGMVAGAEALAVGTLVLLAGTILVVNAWAVIDTRMALESAAREYLRAYTESSDSGSAALEGDLAVEAVLADRPMLLERLALEAPSPQTFGPCAPAAVTLRSPVPAIRIPLVGVEWGQHEVTVSAVELIDAHRQITSSPGYDPMATACHG